MKFRAMILSCLIGAVILSFVYELSRAEAKTDKATLKIGVVSIRKIFQGSNKNATYTQEADAEQKRIVAELQKLQAEIEAEKAGLKTLKEGSSDYMASLKEISIKGANLQAQNDFYRRQIGLKDRKWTEQLYQDILRITKDVAAQNGLDMVLESSEPDLPAPTAEALVDAIRTHKLLYSAGCVDISDEVMARLDTEK